MFTYDVFFANKIIFYLMLLSFGWNVNIVCLVYCFKNYENNYKDAKSWIGGKIFVFSQLETLFDNN